MDLNVLNNNTMYEDSNTWKYKLRVHNMCHADMGMKQLMQITKYFALNCGK